jgi:hypothetical protein
MEKELIAKYVETKRMWLAAPSGSNDLRFLSMYLAQLSQRLGDNLSKAEDAFWRAATC